MVRKTGNSKLIPATNAVDGINFQRGTNCPIFRNVLTRVYVCVCVCVRFVVNFIVQATRDGRRRRSPRKVIRRQKESLIKLALPFRSSDSRPLLERKEDEAKDRVEEET